MLSSYELVTASAILFPKNSPVLWTTFLEAIFKQSSPVSHNCYGWYDINDINDMI